MCSLDANIIAADAACAAALIALGALFVSIWQARFTTRVQALLQLNAAWMSEAMRDARRKAATSLLEGGAPKAQVDRVLDFFETIAGLYVKPQGWLRSRVLPDLWARHTFYWAAVCYWSKSQNYINTVRSSPTERNAWNDFCDLMPRWIKVEGGEPTPGDVDGFLADERGA